MSRTIPPLKQHLLGNKRDVEICWAQRFILSAAESPFDNRTSWLSCKPHATYCYLIQQIDNNSCWLSQPIIFLTLFARWLIFRNDSVEGLKNMKIVLLGILPDHHYANAERYHEFGHDSTFVRRRCATHSKIDHSQAKKFFFNWLVSLKVYSGLERPKYRLGFATKFKATARGSFTQFLIYNW